MKFYLGGVMRNVIAVMMLMVAGTCFAQSGMQVTWPNGSSLTTKASRLDDDSGGQAALVKTIGIYKLDIVEPVTIPVVVYPPVPIVIKQKLRVKFTNDGRASVKWLGNGLPAGETGVTIADGSAPFTVRLVDINNVNRFYNVTVTPIP